MSNTCQFVLTLSSRQYVQHHNEISPFPPFMKGRKCVRQYKQVQVAGTATKNIHETVHKKPP